MREKNTDWKCTEYLRLNVECLYFCSTTPNCVQTKYVTQTKIEGDRHISHRLFVRLPVLWPQMFTGQSFEHNSCILPKDQIQGHYRQHDWFLFPCEIFWSGSTLESMCTMWFDVSKIKPPCVTNWIMSNEIRFILTWYQMTASLKQMSVSSLAQYHVFQPFSAGRHPFSPISLTPFEVHASIIYPTIEVAMLNRRMTPQVLSWRQDHRISLR